MEEAKKRHLEFFNIQPYLASFLVGMTAGMEHRHSTDKMQLLKASTSSALSAMGDSFFWASLRPACMVWTLLGFSWFCVWERPVTWVWVAGFALPTLLYNAWVMWFRWKGLEMGYRHQEELALELKRFPWRPWAQGVRHVGFAGTVGLCILFLFGQPHFWSVLRNFCVIGLALLIRELGISNRTLVLGSLIGVLILGGLVGFGM